MASIVAKNVSLTFPFIGSDSKFGHRVKKRSAGEAQHVGGNIITDSGHQNGVKAIDDLTLSLSDGDRLGIYGHNGAGKTTLLRVLAGIYPPTEGTLRIEGRVTGLFSLGLGINKELSGLENIKIKAMMFGLRRKEILPLIPDIVAFSELGDYIHMPVKTYSSGMSLRLQFSIATALNPDILLMDEWISSADKQFKEKMDIELDEMIEKTPIVIIASHNELRLKTWANTIINMENGRIATTEDTSNYEAPQPAFKPDPSLLKQYTILINLGKLDEAFQLIPQIWPPNSAPGPYHERCAQHYLRINEFEKGVIAYEKAIDYAPNNYKLKDQLGRLYLKNNQYEKAITHIMAALDGSQGTIGNLKSLQAACEKAGISDVYNAYIDDITNIGKHT